MGVWEKFESIVTKEEIEEISKKAYEKPAAGKHIVELMAVEPGETSTGIPIVKFKYRDCDSRQMIISSMFLSNQYYPERTAAEINKVLVVLRKLGNDIEFESMAALESQILETKLGGKYEINLVYKKETDKFPIVEVVRTIHDEDELPFSVGEDEYEII